TSPPPAGALSALTNVLTMVSGRIGGVVAKGKAMQAKRRANKVAPIESKVQARHLELEPLCCLSSCLVRGGCAAVVAFEAFYVLATLLVVLGGMSRGGFTIWEPLPKSWNAWFGHHIFYYCVCAYDAALLCFLIALARGLLTFSKLYEQSVRFRQLMSNPKKVVYFVQANVMTFVDGVVFGRGFRLRVVCFEEKIDQSLVVKKPKKLKCPPSLSDVFSSSINNCLPKVLKNADVHHLHFFMVPLTDDILSTISSCLLHAGSRVHTLSISQTSMAYVSSSMLLRFLRDVAPKAVDLYRIKCFHENLSSEVFQFIATRQHFSVDCFGPDPSLIDDDILSQLTASDFAIAAPNMITIDGLKSFVERVATGKQRVNRGMILANFHLEGIVFPSYPNLKIVTEGRVIKLSTEATDD
ncbi:hypothetical protein TELCIR_03984, partial [Teladorsagia circumcincta]